MGTCEPKVGKFIEEEVRAMWTVIVVVAVVAMLVVVAIRVALAGRPRGTELDKADEQAQIADAESADFPSPGEPSPHRPDGSPIPGSRDDRRAKRHDA